MVVLSVGDSCCESGFVRLTVRTVGNRVLTGVGFIPDWIICRFAMKRVIDRTLYDTNRVEQIAQYAPNTHRGDDYHCLETLYKAPSGESFPHCEGYMSRMKHAVDGGEKKELRKEHPSGWLYLTQHDAIPILVDALLDLPPNHEFNKTELAEHAGVTRQTVDTYTDLLL